MKNSETNIFLKNLWGFLVFLAKIMNKKKFSYLD